MGGNRRGASDVNVMEFASRMRPTTCFNDFASGIDGVIARIGIGLQNAAEVVIPPYLTVV